MKNKFILFLFLLVFAAVSVTAQTKTKFSRAAQKRFIPIELGQVYLGQPFREFARNFDLTKSEADASFGWLEVQIPYAKGSAIEVFFKIHGLSEEETAAVMRVEKIVEKGEGGEFEREVKRVDAAKIPAKGFVYEINITFKKEFDLKSYAVKTYGVAKDVNKTGESPYFYDMQWIKKTPDGLTLMIRSLHAGENRTLKLIGIIDDTEWDPVR